MCRSLRPAVSAPGCRRQELPAGSSTGAAPQRADLRVVLARCLRAAHAGSAEFVDTAVDWTALANAACEASLGGLLVESVQRTGRQPTQSVLGRLRRQADQIERNNSGLLRQLARITRALQSRGVEVLLLKGAALNLTLYDRPNLRPMSDLDLLVRPDSAERAITILESMGFRRGPSLLRADFFPRFHYEVELSSADYHPTRIDLHTRPFRPLRWATTIPDGAFWRGARPVDERDAAASVPAGEEMLVHLATHSACHGHRRLLWLYDLCRLIDTVGAYLDWERVVHICRLLELVLPVREALHKVETLWGPIIPSYIRDDLNAGRTTWRDRLCLAQAPHDATHPVRHVAVNLLCMRGVRFRMQYLLRVLLPDRGHLGQGYGRRHCAWVFVAHLRRSLRLLLGPVFRRMGVLSPR